MSAIFLFLGKDGEPDWLRVDGASIERGRGIEGIDAEARVVAVAPGDAVALHWLDLDPALTPVQAAAAARLMLAEQSADPIADLHVAVGREDGLEPGRCAALVPTTLMTDWVAHLTELGLDRAAIVPEPLLLPIAEEGVVRLDRNGLSLFRAPGEAFAIEADTAALLLGQRPQVEIDSATFDAGLAVSANPPLLDLRQGPFARRRQWRIDPILVRRLAVLGALVLLVTLLIQVAEIMRYTFGADALEAEARQVAAAALPRSPGVTNPSLELSDRLAQLRGGGVGYDATASAVFEAIRATPNVELSGLTFSPDGSLRATVSADNEASLQDVQRRVSASGFVAELGAPRSGGGRRVADLNVRPK